MCRAEQYVGTVPANSRVRVPFIVRLFVWSVMLEPLLFFIFPVPNIDGMVVRLSRILQFIVISFLVIKVFVGPKSLHILRLNRPLTKTYFYYIALMLLASVLGYINGNYDIIDGSVAMYLRPIVEMAIYIYYFFYFVILPGYILNNYFYLNYFFRTFQVVFWGVVIIGLLDLLAVKSGFGFDGIYRHIYDSRSIGLRFHSVIGEPRDAVLYLFLGIAMLYLRDFFYGNKAPNWPRLGLIFGCILLTQSASGVLGILFSLGLIMLFYLPRLSYGKVMIALVSIGIMGVTILYAASYSDRIMLYYDAFQVLYPTLEANQPVRSILQVAMNNIYPIWDMWIQIKNFEIISVFFGSGIGSASYINNYYINTNDVLNPNANIIRSLYETGFVGTILLVLAFLKPLASFRVPKDVYLILLVLMLILIGVFLAHRSAAPFIFLGIAVVTIGIRFSDTSLWPMAYV